MNLKKKFQVAVGYAPVVMYLVALALYQVFNYSVSVYALDSFLGGISVLGIPCKYLLAVALCGMDLMLLVIIFYSKGIMESQFALYALWVIGVAVNTFVIWSGLSLAAATNPDRLVGVLAQMPWIVTEAIFAVILMLVRLLMLSFAIKLGEKSKAKHYTQKSLHYLR